VTLGAAVSSGSRPSGRVYQLPGASKTLTDAQASLSGPLLPGSYGYHMLDSIYCAESNAETAYTLGGYVQASLAGRALSCRNQARKGPNP
jgi:hypothetical protein